MPLVGVIREGLGDHELSRTPWPRLMFAREGAVPTMHCMQSSNSWALLSVHRQRVEMQICFR